VILCASPAYLERAGAPEQPEDLSRHSCLNFSHEYLRHHWHVNTESGVMDVPIVSKVVSNSGVLLRDLAWPAWASCCGLPIRSGTICDAASWCRSSGFDMGQVVISMVYPSRRLLSPRCAALPFHPRASAPGEPIPG
jgi:DNA-binding transcriptional LysR family regulator